MHRVLHLGNGFGRHRHDDTEQPPLFDLVAGYAVCVDTNALTASVGCFASWRIAMHVSSELGRNGNGTATYTDRAVTKRAHHEMPRVCEVESSGAPTSKTQRALTEKMASGHGSRLLVCDNVVRLDRSRCTI